ncbi:MAG: hypothetical protein PHE43_03375 [Candidatus Nanoarchaeia archaeon]|nr:hypothetical protein [Candidatus Nanoarchaeia archaeon]
MAKLLLKTHLKRESGKLYFLKGSPLAVYEANMKRGGTKKKAKKKK